MNPSEGLPIGYGASSDEEGGSGPGSGGASQRFQMMIDPEVARGEYANYFQIRFTPIELVMDFCRIIPDANVVEVVSRVLIHPQQSRLLLEMLQINLAAYQQQFGSGLGASVPSTGQPGIGFRTSEDLRRMGLDVPLPRRIQLPSDPSKPDPGAAAKTG